MSNIQAVHGFKDILPEEADIWRKAESCAHEVCRRFGLREIRTPILEKTELFIRSIGASTDVVEKEMYSFADKGQTMRPEATASIMRAFIEHGLHVRQPVQRLYTIGPMFRHERPQKGRLRQFHQLDAEIIGAVEPQIDAELIALGQMFFDELGLELSLELNSLGCPLCRPPYRSLLIGVLEDKKDKLCPDCQRRLHTNPLRALDCKQPSCRALVRDAPAMGEHLCEACDQHFRQVRTGLELLGVHYRLNRFMVRGLDYYTRTTFEFITTELGAQAAVGGGGRYDGLIEELGGPALPGIGFAMGMERIVLLMQQQKATDLAEGMDIFLAPLGSEALAHCSLLAQLLRRKGMKAALEYSGRGLKAQMKQADRVKARFVLIIGEQEWRQQEAILRNMDTQQQRPFALNGTPQEQAMRLVACCAPF